MGTVKARVEVRLDTHTYVALHGMYDTVHRALINTVVIHSSRCAAGARTSNRDRAFIVPIFKVQYMKSDVDLASSLLHKSRSEIRKNEAQTE